MKEDLNSHPRRSFNSNDSILGPNLFPNLFTNFLCDLSTRLGINANDRNIYSCLNIKSNSFDEFKLAADV